MTELSPNRFHAAVFDMDGLLIDSEPFWRRAEKEIFPRVGVELTEADCLQTTGLRIDEVVDYWFERRPWATNDYPADRKRLADAIVNRVAELVRLDGEPLPGVQATLDELTAAGLPLGLATSSARSLIEAVFDALDRHLTEPSAKVFRAVCTATEEARGKPAPDVYLTTCRLLGAPPNRCVAFEDSVAGVESAHAAGMTVVAVPAPGDRNDSRYASAHLVLDSLADFRLELLREPDHFQ